MSLNDIVLRKVEVYIPKYRYDILEQISNRNDVSIENIIAGLVGEFVDDYDHDNYEIGT